MIYLLHKKGVIYVEKNEFFSNPFCINNKEVHVEEKIRLLDSLECSPHFSPLESLLRLIDAKVYEKGHMYSAISELKNVILDA